jgi:hypothetical protein
VYVNCISSVNAGGVGVSSNLLSENLILCVRNTRAFSEHFIFRRNHDPLHSQCIMNIIFVTIFMSIATFHVQYASSSSAYFTDVFQECLLWVGD